MPWYAAKCSIESTARYYLERAGIEIFRPVEHHYFIEPRTKHEKFRVRSIFVGYVFFRADDQDQMNRASHVDGVAYVLGEWRNDRFIAKPMPEGWIEKLIEAGPVICGRKRAKFNSGDEVRVIIAGVREIVGRVVRDAGKGKVTISTAGLFGQEVEIDAKPEMVEAV